jgi:hypothetical protein
MRYQILHYQYAILDHLWRSGHFVSQLSRLMSQKFDESAVREHDSTTGMLMGTAEIWPTCAGTVDKSVEKDAH